MIGGKLYRVKLTVKDYTATLGKRTLHALEAVEIESAPLGTLLSYSSDTTLRTAQPTTGRMVSITQLLDGAQLEDGTLIIDGNLKK